MVLPALCGRVTLNAECLPPDAQREFTCHRFPAERQAGCRRYSTLPSEGFEATAHYDAENAYGRQEPCLSEREPIKDTVGKLSRFARLRQVESRDDIVGQDHRRIERLVRRGLGSKSMRTARPIIAGSAIFAMIREAQVTTIPANDMRAQRAFIALLFAVAA